MKPIWGAVLALMIVATAQAKTPPPSDIPALSPLDGWEFKDEEDGIRTWTQKDESSGLVAFRGGGVVEASIEKVSGVLRDRERKKEWIAYTAEGRTVRDVNDWERIEYNRSSPPWPIKDRDFVLRAGMKVRSDSKEVFFYAVSIESTEVPETSAVRGWVAKSYFRLKALDPKRTEVHLEIHADPKGGLPKWLVNMVQKSWAYRTISGLRKMVLRDDVPLDEDVKAMMKWSG